jgi:hypothetical protein
MTGSASSFQSPVCTIRRSPTSMKQRMTFRDRMRHRDGRQGKSTNLKRLAGAEALKGQRCEDRIRRVLRLKQSLSEAAQIDRAPEASAKG